MDQEKARLEKLAAKMSPNKRKEMADMLNAELQRRESQKRSVGVTKTNIASSAITGGLDSNSVGELYADVEQTVRQMKIQKLERQIEAAKVDQERMSKYLSSRKFGLAEIFKLPKFNLRMPSMRAPESMVMYGVAAFGVAKILFSSGVVNATIYPPTDGSMVPKLVLEQPVGKMPSTPAATAAEAVKPALAPLDKELLTQLDGRRAELDKRDEALDQREGELKSQEQSLADKLAELRSLTEQVKLARKERERGHDARLEQLASVYGSMAPADAAPLFAKLDDEISLALLERMPEKRMGQILSSMAPDQAIKLTTALTERGKL